MFTLHFRLMYRSITDMFMIIFPECMASSSFYPLGICAVYVGNNVVVRFIKSGISKSFQQDYFLVIISFFLLFCHEGPLLSIFVRVYESYSLYQISYGQNWSIHYQQINLQKMKQAHIIDFCLLFKY